MITPELPRHRPTTQNFFQTSQNIINSNYYRISSKQSCTSYTPNRIYYPIYYQNLDIPIKYLQFITPLFTDACPYK